MNRFVELGFPDSVGFNAWGSFHLRFTGLRGLSSEIEEFEELFIVWYIHQFMAKLLPPEHGV